MACQALRAFIDRHRRLFILTGAGCSTDSGIPAYRAADGRWKGARPVMFHAFMGELSTRQRYWARSLVGWRRFGRVRPNDAHRALAVLQHLGKAERLVTQNVDRLHQAAGSTGVIDLHGRLDQVVCMHCGRQTSREQMQSDLLALNPEWAWIDGGLAPDGDAALEARDFATFRIPACVRCDGILKPNVVFFGESVPAPRVATAMEHLETSDAVLVVGSSLMVYSGYRFVYAAAKRGTPIAAVNLGTTRADELLQLKVAAPCAAALAFLLAQSTTAVGA